MSQKYKYEKQVFALQEERRKLPPDREGRLRVVDALQEHANLLGLHILSVDVKTTKSKVFVYCPFCQKNSNGTRIDHFINQSSVRCCADKAKKVSPFSRLLPLLRARGHELVGPPPSGYYDAFEICCPRHEKNHTTTFYDYRKATYGTFFCGHEEGAKNRILHGESVGRKCAEWRVSSEMGTWKRRVRKIFSGQCILTGKTDVEAHHIFSSSTYPALRYVVSNGILLWADVHRDYHSFIGWRNPSSFFKKASLLEYVDYIASRQKLTTGKPLNLDSRRVELTLQFLEKQTLDFIQNQKEK